ncbi:MAG TPA: hypothetical protein VHB97_15825 [Polyangia bacterium]|jgi:hypothetical protein|nr:hypothetical protein [Polyangia bacterium]
MKILACLACVLAIGCGGSSGGGGGSGGTGGGGTGGTGGGGTGGTGGGGTGGGGGGGTGGSGGGGGGTPVSITGTIQSSGGGGSTKMPIAGVTVTITGTTTSTTTAADGTYTLMASAGSTIFLTASLTNYQASQIGFVVPAAGGAVPTFQLLTNAQVAAATAGLSPPLTLDTSKGDVIVQFVDQSMTPGYSATISASHGMEFDPSTSPSTYATTTSGNGSEQPLVFPNAVTGTTTITVTPATGKTCTPAVAITNWRVDANVFTFLSYNCQ